MGLYLLHPKKSKRLERVSLDRGTSSLLYGGRTLRKCCMDQGFALNSKYKKIVLFQFRGDNKIGNILKIDLNLNRREKLLHFQIFGKTKNWLIGVTTGGRYFICSFNLDIKKLLFERKKLLYPNFNTINEEAATVAIADDNSTIFIHTCNKMFHPRMILVYELEKMRELKLKRKFDVSSCCTFYFYSFDFFNNLGGKIFMAGVEAYSEPNSFCVFSYDPEEEIVEHWSELNSTVNGRISRLERLGGFLIGGSTNLSVYEFCLEIDEQEG